MRSIRWGSGSAANLSARFETSRSEERGISLFEVDPAGPVRTPARGWAVLLLFRCHLSTAILISYTFGVFLPFIREDLQLSPLQAGLLQGIWWVTPAVLSIPVGTWLSRFRPVPMIMFALVLQLPFLFLQGLAENFITLFSSKGALICAINSGLFLYISNSSASCPGY